GNRWCIARLTCAAEIESALSMNPAQLIVAPFFAERRKRVVRHSLARPLGKNPRGLLSDQQTSE
ncbi:MAG TPA: hypothetical protein VFR42_00595, partial [Candidatus Acidoferrum sp.]|nr:hypothetical protein [Candidatus Acidoferrum sp.]